jgi:hypothetical protein
MRGHGRSVGQAAGTAVSLAVSTSTQDGDVVAARRILRAHSPCHEVPPGAEITPGVAPGERGPGATDATRHQVDLRERRSTDYFRRLRAITMRWTWLVPS